ncbi:hypothetical protein [Urbifossiella limnaea]|uniref:Uncharacterized protein n=1 Tax=Urbifossiella limnaea TaxID=2528023 RepID=A0A517XZQ3_9BACT|nr:hypothetical protein [Urbifossiella limnaea]QDU22995.1 hypothetical protein ETAA1_49850 [Urbifossiella limnaea]
MSMTNCPSCGLPRADELLAVAPCPLCGADGHPVAVEAPPPPPEPVAAPPPPAAASSHFGLGLVIGLLLGTALGAGVVLGWPARPSPEPDTVAAAAPPADTPPLPPTPKSPDAPAVAPPTVPTAKDKPNPFRPTGPTPLVLDNPDGETRPVVRPGGHLVLAGQVKRLVVPGLKAGAVLDASQLSAAEVEVTGPIDGGARLVARAPGGTVVFRATVDGGSVVDVVGRQVTFDAPVGGANTRVTVALTSGGELRVAALTGSARLQYRRATPADPPVRLSVGRVTPPAVVVEVP